MSAEIPRRAQRTPLAMPAQCHTVDGQRESGEICNISTHGCCITCVDRPFRVGSHLVIYPEGSDMLGGAVRWIARDCAGVEFDSAIPARTVEHMVQMHPQGTPVLLTRG